tara:strand:+ start:2656 stop:3738 length:1083 start_codon:yes stop_codon:yes gene_type:complete
VQLPPPLHGAAAMNQSVTRPAYLNGQFDIEVLPIQLSQKLQDIGSPSFRKLASVFTRSVKLMLTLFLRRPRLVYFALPPFGGAFYASLPFVFLIKLFRIPLIYHFHGKGVAKQAERSTVYRRVMKWALANSRIILLSPLLFEDLSAFVDRAAVSFIPNGISLPERMAFEEGEDAHVVPQILFLSNLVITKGPLILLDALASLRQSGVSFQAIFAGAETAAISATRFASEVQVRQLQDYVQYKGPVGGEAKRALFQQANIFAFPTYNDAFPLALLEAMSFGLPIVTTNEGAIPDIVTNGENGLVVARQDPTALADALRALIEQPDLRHKMKQRNVEKFVREYPLEKFEERMATVWSQALNS